MLSQFGACVIPNLRRFLMQIHISFIRYILSFLATFVHSSLTSFECLENTPICSSLLLHPYLHHLTDICLFRLACFYFFLSIMHYYQVFLVFISNYYEIHFFGKVDVFKYLFISIIHGLILFLLSYFCLHMLRFYVFQI